MSKVIDSISKTNFTDIIDQLPEKITEEAIPTEDDVSLETKWLSSKFKYLINIFYV